MDFFPYSSSSSTFSRNYNFHYQVEEKHKTHNLKIVKLKRHTLDSTKYKFRFLDRKVVRYTIQNEIGIFIKPTGTFKGKKNGNVCLKKLDFLVINLRTLRSGFMPELKNIRRCTVIIKRLSKLIKHSIIKS